jgi:Flp pilus assembly protein TadG
MRIFRDERGQATFLMGMCIASLCGMAALSVDVGMLFRAKRISQNAADAAAIAGAMEQPYGDWWTAAQAAATDNGLTDGVNGVTVSVTKQSGSTIKVVVTQTAATYFMKAFHINSMNVNARATAALGPGSGCIFTLNQSGVDVGLSGNGNLTMPDCGVLVDSGSSKALTLTGNSSIAAKYIGIVGNYSDSSNSPNSLVPIPVTNIAAASDPLAGKVTAPTYDPTSCQVDPHPTTTTTIGPSDPTQPVCYNGLSISGGGDVTLKPGVYVINGAFSTTGNVNVNIQTTAQCLCTDPGVTFYLPAPSGSVSLSGTGSLSLAAPTTATNAYNGILFYQNKLDTKAMTISGSSSALIAGIVYAPGALLSLSGTSGSGGSQFYLNMVVNTLSISGSNSLLNYSDVNSSTPLTMPRLTE